MSSLKFARFCSHYRASAQAKNMRYFVASCLGRAVEVLHDHVARVFLHTMVCYRWLVGIIMAILSKTTFINNTECKARHCYEAVAQCIVQDSVGADNDADILQHSVPDDLIGPSLDVVIPYERTKLVCR